MDSAFGVYDILVIEIVNSLHEIGTNKVLLYEF